MNKLFTSILMTAIPVIAFSQVVIEPGPKTAPTNASVSLEFGDHQNKGLVIPYVTASNAQTPISDGTFIMDPSDNIMKFRENGTWRDLTGPATKTNAVDVSIQVGKDENERAKTVIGKENINDNTRGILILTDTDKAMILPRVALPHLNIKNPAAGMMAYDTVNKQLAVFNGTQWTFWQATR
ncbi:hypothetical protein OA84_05335 [Kaistella solincola]|uniref:Uncharacterized protein n=2 Tax=Kaistella TaxID=2782231 RepID=A0A1I3KVS1_9FLAO|nr:MULTISPECIES: hypothetical protein [Kaistella]KIA82985.1 hypothetical protein OA84_05335 [Kaistella solincola]SFI76547.1 hypothetical protein SAMN05421638_1044 [Kaistella treverensis]